MKICIAVVGLLLLAPAARAEDAVDVCKQVEKTPFPEGDKPTEKEKLSLGDCDTEALYYGIGLKADPVAARKCAFTQLGGDLDTVFGGTAILMVIYANGKGVKQNFDLAIELACQIGGAPAEIDGRV